MCCRGQRPQQPASLLTHPGQLPILSLQILQGGASGPIVLLPCPCSQLQGLALAAARSGFKTGKLLSLRCCQWLLVLGLASFHIYQPAVCSFIHDNQQHSGMIA